MLTKEDGCSSSFSFLFFALGIRSFRIVFATRVEFLMKSSNILVCCCCVCSQIMCLLAFIGTELVAACSNLVFDDLASSSSIAVLSCAPKMLSIFHSTNSNYHQLAQRTHLLLILAGSRECWDSRGADRTEIKYEKCVKCLDSRQLSFFSILSNSIRLSLLLLIRKKFVLSRCYQDNNDEEPTTVQHKFMGAPKSFWSKINVLYKTYDQQLRMRLTRCPLGHAPLKSSEIHQLANRDPIVRAGNSIKRIK